MQATVDTLEQIRETSIATTMPCPDPHVKHQWYRGSLTSYIFKQRGPERDKFERVRETMVARTNPYLDS